METTLIIARHGNTFKSNEVPRRIGGKTDLPLVESEKGKKLGLYLKRNLLIPDIIFSSPLLRTIQTTTQAMQAIGKKNYPLIISEDFREIDYGPDENKTEEEVINRLGENSIRKWNDENVVPDGWNISPETLIKNWKEFGEKIDAEYKGKIILVVTSNGIARFSPYLTKGLSLFKNQSLKIATGAICIFKKDTTATHWENSLWNFKP